MRVVESLFMCFFRRISYVLFVRQKVPKTSALGVPYATH